MKRMINCILKGVAVGLLTVVTSQVYAAGYKMEFQSASVLADAGDAAVVEDAGTNWYNSAGLVYLPQQLVASAIDLYVRTEFSGTSFAPGLGSDFHGAGTATSYVNSILPALHYSLPVKDRWALGLSVVPAWGFSEDYGWASILRYDLTRVYTKTLDVAPSAAMKINDHWSVGLGPDFNYFSLEERSNARTEYITGTDSISHVSADDWNYGWHAGVLYRMDDATRVGLNYRSKIVMNLKGYSNFGYTGIHSTETNHFTFHFALPPTTSLSAYHDMTPSWALMGTIAYDQWAVLRDYNAQNYMGLAGLINVSLPQGFKNTFDFSLGTHYKFNEKWMLRGSVKYEPTPTSNQYRDVDFPDGDKLGFQIGGRYQMNKKIAMDFLYGHVFTRTVPINLTNPVTFVKTNGHSSTSINLLGAQLVWNI